MQMADFKKSVLRLVSLHYKYLHLAVLEMDDLQI